MGGGGGNAFPPAPPPQGPVGHVRGGGRRGGAAACRGGSPASGRRGGHPAGRPVPPLLYESVTVRAAVGRKASRRALPFLCSGAQDVAPLHGYCSASRPATSVDSSPTRPGICWFTAVMTRTKWMVSRQAGVPSSFTAQPMSRAEAADVLGWLSAYP